MYSAKIYIAVEYPEELWLAVYDANGIQLLHAAFDPSLTVPSNLCFYSQPGAWDIAGFTLNNKQGDVQTVLEALSCALEEVL